MFPRMFAVELAAIPHSRISDQNSFHGQEQGEFQRAWVPISQSTTLQDSYVGTEDICACWSFTTVKQLQISLHKYRDISRGRDATMKKKDWYALKLSTLQFEATFGMLS